MSSIIRITVSLFLGLSLTVTTGYSQGKSWKSDDTGTKTWGNGNSWKDVDSTEKTGVPEDDDTAIVEAGELEIENLRGIGYLRVAGGNLRGASGVDFDTLELRGNSAHSEWFNGSIRQLSLLIASGAFLDVYNTSVNDFEGSVIENSGTLTWTDGNLTTDGDGGITNQSGALFADQTIDSVSIRSSAAPFDNYGTYHKTGSGTTTVTLPASIR